LDVPAFGPRREGSSRAPPQKAKDADGRSTQVARVAAAAVPIAVAASFHRRQTR